MKRITIIIIFFASGLVRAQAAQGGAPEVCGDLPKAHISITINPEARVSVGRGSEPVPEAGPDGTVELQLHIINHGFLTAPLEARLVGLVPEGAKVDFAPQPLTGAREEQRLLRVRLARPGLADVTISFRAMNDMIDLGGRDRVHFLLRYR